MYKAVNQPSSIPLVPGIRTVAGRVARVIAALLVVAVVFRMPDAEAQKTDTVRDGGAVSAPMQVSAPATDGAAAQSRGGGADMLDFTVTGFVFAIVNFLILMALLYKFLHNPLLNVLDKRKASIEAAQTHAREQAEQAEKTRTTYETKLAAIEEERDKLLSDAKNRVAAERDALLAKARQQAEREVATVKRDWERRKREALEEVQDSVLDAGLALVDRLLDDLADSDCDTKLFEKMVRELRTMAENPDTDRRNLFVENTPVRVVSARTLADADRATVSEALTNLAGHPVTVDFAEDAGLVAGVRIEFVATAVDATVAAMLADVRKEADDDASAEAPLPAPEDTESEDDRT